MASLWNLFDEEFDKKKPLECLYDNNELCDNKCNICKTMLIIDDNGFNICPNNKCGIIYKNSLDSSPEWRFFGSDDNQGSDPTRCGMPINPLLMSSRLINLLTFSSIPNTRRPCIIFVFDNNVSISLP